MFKKAAKDIVDELDPSGELIPLTSAYESKTLDLLSVVKVVKSSWMYFFTVERYIPTNVKLPELLLCGDDIDCGAPCQQDVGGLTMTHKEGAEVLGQATAGSFGSVQANVDFRRNTSILDSKLERISINFSKLSKILNTGMEVSHVLIKEMKKNVKGSKLGVVYDILKIKNPLSLQQTFKGTGKAKFSVLNIGTMDNTINTEKEKQLHLEAGSALGFKLLYIPLDLGNKSPLASLDSDGVADMVKELPCDSFPALKNMVDRSFIVLDEMGREVIEMIWDPLSAILGCVETLYVLDCILEEGFLCAEGSSLLDSVPLQFKPKVQELLSLVDLDHGKSSDSPLIKPLSLLVSSMLEIDEEAVSLIVTLNREIQEQLIILVEGLLEGVYKNTVEDKTWSDLFVGSSVDMAREVLKASGALLDETQPYPALGAPGKPSLILISIYVVLKGLRLLKSL